MTNKAMDTPLDWTKPIRTRDGREVRIYDREAGGEYPVIAGVPDVTGCFHAERYKADGAFSNTSSGMDLINAPAKVKVDCWVNVRADGTLGAPFPFRADLDRSASAIDRVAVKHITFEIEEGTIDE